MSYIVRALIVLTFLQLKLISCELPSVVNYGTRVFCRLSISNMILSRLKRCVFVSHAKYNLHYIATGNKCTEFHKIPGSE